MVVGVTQLCAALSSAMQSSWAALSQAASPGVLGDFCPFSFNELCVINSKSSALFGLTGWRKHCALTASRVPGSSRSKMTSWVWFHGRDTSSPPLPPAFTAPSTTRHVEVTGEGCTFLELHQEVRKQKMGSSKKRHSCACQSRMQGGRISEFG